MGKFVPSYELPNWGLLEKLCYSIRSEYIGEMNTPYMHVKLKHDINWQVNSLIEKGYWITRSIDSDGRRIKFVEVDVLTIDDMPNDVKIVQVWEYEEDFYGEDSESSDKGHMESPRRITY